MLVDGKGCWLSRHTDRNFARGTPAIFLDRDKVLLDDPGYLHSPSQVRLLEGAAELVAWANTCNLPTIMVTNQSGIGRGLYGWHDFHAVNNRMHALLSEAGAAIDVEVACAWHEDGMAPLKAPDHHWRKPQPGMLIAAAEEIGCQLATSWMVGDRKTDMEAAYNAGLSGGVWICEDHTPGQLWLRELSVGSFEVFPVQSMKLACDMLKMKLADVSAIRSNADAL